MSEQKISISRTVHFVLPDGPNAGEHRPAVVVRIWSETTLNLQVFTDSDPKAESNDQLPQEDENMSGGTWYWPERE